MEAAHVRPADPCGSYGLEGLTVLYFCAACCRYIRSINRQNLNYKLAPNHLVDLTDAEYDGHGGW